MAEYSTPSEPKTVLGESGGEAEDSKNRKAKQHDGLSTHGRKGRKHPVTLAHISESPQKMQTNILQKNSGVFNKKTLLLLLYKLIFSFQS